MVGVASPLERGGRLLCFKHCAQQPSQSAHLPEFPPLRREPPQSRGGGGTPAIVGKGPPASAVLTLPSFPRHRGRLHSTSIADELLRRSGLGPPPRSAALRCPAERRGGKGECSAYPWDTLAWLKAAPWFAVFRWA